MTAEKVEANEANKQAMANLDLDDEDEDTQKDKYLTFRIGEEDYGIEISYVTEIVGMQHISEVPEMPDFVKGVMNLRGQIIPVMDVRLRFDMEARPYDDRTCVVVVRMGETSVGLVVDTVKEVLNIPEQAVTEPPRVASAKSARYIKGIGRLENEVKILIDVNTLLHDEEREALGTLA
jgi:purine-binding chemotaxis protein CheW